MTKRAQKLTTLFKKCTKKNARSQILSKANFCRKHKLLAVLLYTLNEFNKSGPTNQLHIHPQTPHYTYPHCLDNHVQLQLRILYRLCSDLTRHYTTGSSRF